MARGLDSRHEFGASQMARDTRPLGTRFAEFMSSPNAVVVTAVVGIAVAFFIPAIGDLAFFVCCCIFLFSATRKIALPFRVPITANFKDYSDPIPGTNNPKVGSAISFFGNELSTGEELWFNNDDLRTHVLIFGSTGSGKTEALVSIAFNSLIQSSGFIYIDGKGDNSLFAKIFSMVRAMGREDDMLLINFMTGARDVMGPQKNRLSNTMNPFAQGSSSMISQLVVSLMDSSSQGGSGDMWKGRAISFVESLMKVLVPMREAGHILLDAHTIREYFMLEKLVEMVEDKKFTTPKGDVVSLETYPSEVLQPMKGYLATLPGYVAAKKADQSGEVREQHGFITMQLTRAFSSLADTYGHIIRTNLAEVDFKDVILNRRILVVLLPALEKSPDELANLGKIIIASLKAMMASGLGDEVEGDYKDVVQRKPTTSPSPFVCIMDEYGYYAVPGFAVVPAQARSLGFSAVFAGQDLPAFQKASKEEAASIGANCNIKICMKLEDPMETWEYFNKTAGETYVTNVSGFQMNAGSVALNYMDNKSASIDRRQRIDLLDLKDQKPGEAHIFFKSKIVRASMFFANPRPVKKMRINHMLKIAAPSLGMLLNVELRLKRFEQILSDPKYTIPSVQEPTIDTIARLFIAAPNDYDAIQRSSYVMLQLIESLLKEQKRDNFVDEQDKSYQEINIFTKIPADNYVTKVIQDDQINLFKLPLLRRGSTKQELSHLVRLMGGDKDQSEKDSNKIVQDLENASIFPPEIRFDYTEARMINDLTDLIEQNGGVVPDLSGLEDLTAPESTATLRQKAFNREIEAEETPLQFDENQYLNEIPDTPNLDSLDDMEKWLKDFEDRNMLNPEFALNNAPEVPNKSTLDEIEELIAKLEEEERNKDK